MLGLILRLLHPAMPFVTEELWDRFGYGAECSLIRAPWPEPFAVPGAAEARAELDWVVRLIAEVRTVRAEMNVPPSMPAPVLLQDAAPETLARARALDRGDPPPGARVRAAAAGRARCRSGSAQAVLDEATVVLPLAGLIDLAAERARLEKERGKAAAEAEKVAQKLAIADFVARAPRRRWWRRTASGSPPRSPTSPGSRRRWRGLPRAAGPALVSTSVLFNTWRVACSKLMGCMPR